MKNYVRYVIGVLFIIIVIILIVFGFNAIRNLFNNSPADKKTAVKKVNLIDAGKEGQTVRYTTTGSVQGDEDHYSVRITVNNNARRVELLRGYDQTVVKTQESPNNQEAYNAFIAALNGAGFTNSIDPKGRGSESQSCPLGKKYSFEVAPDTSNAFRSWSNNCSTKQGTFTGRSNLVRTLFLRQIPDYNKFLSDIDFS